MGLHRRTVHTWHDGHPSAGQPASQDFFQTERRHQWLVLVAMHARGDEEMWTCLSGIYGDGVLHMVLFMAYGNSRRVSMRDRSVCASRVFRLWLPAQ